MYKQPKILRYENKSIFNAIKRIEHRYLQHLVDAGAIIIPSADTYWLLCEHGNLLFKVNEDDSVHLEVVSVNVVQRRQGNGNYLMNIVTTTADCVQLAVTLRVSVVRMPHFAPHPALVAGAITKNKIPVRLLPNWYMKFGFKFVDRKQKTMIYEPNEPSKAHLT